MTGIAGDRKSVVNGRRVEVLVERPRHRRKQAAPLVFVGADREVARDGAEPRFAGRELAVADVEPEGGCADAQLHDGVPEARVQGELAVGVGARRQRRKIE